MRALLALLLGIYASSGCDIREASLVDMALDMEMPATICIRVLTRRTGEWALSNSFPEVWSAKMIRNSDLVSDNTVVCLHNRSTSSEYVIACRGTFCTLPLKKLEAVELCTVTLAEMMLRIDFFCGCYCVFSLIFAHLSIHYETRPFPRWMQKSSAFLGRLWGKIKKKKEVESQKD